MKASPHSIIAIILPLLILLFSHETSAHKRSAPAHDDSNATLDHDIDSCPKMTSYEGKWVLVEAEVFENNTKISLPPKDIVFTFGMGMGNSDYGLGIDAANGFGASFNITGQNNDCYDEIEVGGVIYTLMYPPKEFLPIETFFKQYLESMKLIKAYEQEDDTMLVMEGDFSKLICKYIKPAHTVYEGKWKIITATNNENAVSLPDDDDIIIEFTPDKEKPSGYDWYAKASNRFWTKVDIVGANDEFDIIEVGPYVASTLMTTDEKHEEIEMFFTTALVGMDKLKKYEEDGDEMLVMKGNNTEMRCERFVPNPRVYTGKWELARAVLGGDDVIYPKDAKIEIRFAADAESSSYTIVTQVVNIMRTSVDVLDQDDDGYDDIKVGKVASTRMAVPEEFQDLESFFWKLEVMEKMKSYMEEDWKLVMFGDGVELYANWIDEV